MDDLLKNLNTLKTPNADHIGSRRKAVSERTGSSTLDILSQASRLTEMAPKKKESGDILLIVDVANFSDALDKYILKDLGFELSGTGGGSYEYVGKGSIKDIQNKLVAKFGKSVGLDIEVLDLAEFNESKKKANEAKDAEVKPETTQAPAADADLAGKEKLPKEGEKEVKELKGDSEKPEKGAEQLDGGKEDPKPKDEAPKALGTSESIIEGWGHEEGLKQIRGVLIGRGQPKEKIDAMGDNDVKAFYDELMQKEAAAEKASESIDVDDQDYNEVTPTVRLADDTVGQFNGEAYAVRQAIEAGAEITVQLHDENGNIIFKSGIPVEILEESHKSIHESRDLEDLTKKLRGGMDIVAETKVNESADYNVTFPAAQLTPEVEARLKADGFENVNVDNGTATFVVDNTNDDQLRARLAKIFGEEAAETVQIERRPEGTSETKVEKVAEDNPDQLVKDLLEKHLKEDYRPTNSEVVSQATEKAWTALKDNQEFLDFFKQEVPTTKDLKDAGQRLDIMQDHMEDYAIEHKLLPQDVMADQVDWWTILQRLENATGLKIAEGKERSAAKSLKESIDFDHSGTKYRVALADDGTLDTVIRITNVATGHETETRFETEYAAQYRDAEGGMTSDGLVQLAKDAIDGGDMDEHRKRKSVRRAPVLEKGKRPILTNPTVKKLFELADSSQEYKDAGAPIAGVAEPDSPAELKNTIGSDLEKDLNNATVDTAEPKLVEPERVYLGMCGTKTYYALLTKTEDGKLSKVDVYDDAEEKVKTFENQENQDNIQVLDAVVTGMSLDSVNYQLLTELGVLDFETAEEKQEAEGKPEEEKPEENLDNPEAAADQPPELGSDGMGPAAAKDGEQPSKMQMENITKIGKATLNEGAKEELAAITLKAQKSHSQSALVAWNKLMDDKASKESRVQALKTIESEHPELKTELDAWLTKWIKESIAESQAFEVGKTYQIPTGNAQVVYGIKGTAGEKFAVTEDGTMLPRGKYEVVEKGAGTAVVGKEFSDITVKGIQESAELDTNQKPKKEGDLKLDGKPAKDDKVSTDVKAPAGGQKKDPADDDLNKGKSADPNLNKDGVKKTDGSDAPVHQGKDPASDDLNKGGSDKAPDQTKEVEGKKLGEAKAGTVEVSLRNEGHEFYVATIPSKDLPQFKEDAKTVINALKMFFDQGTWTATVTNAKGDPEVVVETKVDKIADDNADQLVKDLLEKHGMSESPATATMAAPTNYAERLETMNRVIDLIRANQPLPAELQAFIDAEAAHNGISAEEYTSGLKQAACDDMVHERLSKVIAALKEKRTIDKIEQMRLHEAFVSKGFKYLNELARPAQDRMSTLLAVAKAKKATPEQLQFLEKTGKKATNFTVRISHAEAVALLKAGINDIIMNKEYGADNREPGEEDDWVGLSPDDLDTIEDDPDTYENFELWLDESRTRKGKSITERKIREGTWAVPFTPEKAAKLATIVKNLKANKKVTGSELYDVFGADDLFDALEFVDKGDETSDMVAGKGNAQIIQRYLGDMLADYEADPSSFRDKLSDKVKQILQGILKG